MAARARVGALAPLAVAAFVSCAVATASASAPDTYGFGSRGASMGGAVSADVTDFSAGYYNPAGLVGARGLEISIGYGGASNQLRTNGLDNGVPSVSGLVGGLVAPGEILGIPFAFGIATFMPDNGLSRIKALREGTPRWQLYDDRQSVLFLSANLAIRPLPFLEIGGGVAFLAATRGRFSVTGRADVLSPYDSELRHEVDADLTAIRYPLLGARVEVGYLGHVGLVYRGQSKLPLSMDASLDGVVDFAGIEVPLLYEIEARTLAAFRPQQVVLGLSFRGVRRLHVNLDLAWVNWSAYESPTARTEASMTITPPPGFAIDIPDPPRPTTPLPPRFSDRFVPRLGIEYVLPASRAVRLVRGEERTLIEIPLRGGYVYERSPVPPQSGVTNFIDADRHTVTAGFGVALNAPIEELPGAIRLDAHGAFSALPARLHEKSSPADAVGDYVADGIMLALGATLGASF